MIFNGFQARIILSNHGSLNETFARLRPQQAQQTSATASNERVDDQKTTSDLLYPLDVTRYSPKVVSSVLDVFRSGAVLLPLAHLSSDAGEEKTTRPSADPHASNSNGLIGNAAQAETEEVKDTGSLYLSFRYVGKRHTSASRASELDDIANAQLETKQAILHTEDCDKNSADDDKKTNDQQQQQQRRRSEDDREFYRNCDDDFTANAVFVEEVSTASGTTSNSREESGDEKKKKKDRAEDGKSTSLNLGSRIAKRFIRPASPAESKENQSTAAELFVDGQLVPLIGIGFASNAKERNIAQRQAEKQGFAIAVFKGGGGRIDLSELLERKDKSGRGQEGKNFRQGSPSELALGENRNDVHTLTLHLWDAMRKDVVKVERPRSRLLSSGSKQSGAKVEAKDLKKTAAPDVIFHFEIHFAHTSTKGKGETALQTKSSTNEATSIEGKDLDVNIDVSQDGQTSRRASSNLARRVSPLQSVKEESPIAAVGSKFAVEDVKKDVDRPKESEAMTSGDKPNKMHEGVRDAAATLNVVESQREDKIGGNDRGGEEKDKHVADDPTRKIGERDSVADPSSNIANAVKGTLRRSASSPAAAKKDKKGKAREQASHPQIEHSDQRRQSERQDIAAKVQSAAKTSSEGPKRNALRRLAVTFVSGLHKAPDRERHGRSISNGDENGRWDRLMRSVPSQANSRRRRSISVASGLDQSINANDDLWEALKTLRQLRKEYAAIEAERDRLERELQELHLRGIEGEKQSWIKKVQDAREQLEHLKQELERAQKATGSHKVSA